MITLSAVTALLDPQSTGDAPKLDPVALVLHASMPVKVVLVILVAVLGRLLARRSARSALHISRARGESKRFLEGVRLSAELRRARAGARGVPRLAVRAHLRRRLRRDDAASRSGERGRARRRAGDTHVESGDAPRRRAGGHPPRVVDEPARHDRLDRRRSSASSAPSTGSWTRSSASETSRTRTSRSSRRRSPRRSSRRRSASSRRSPRSWRTTTSRGACGEIADMHGRLRRRRRRARQARRCLSHGDGGGGGGRGRPPHRRDERDQRDAAHRRHARAPRHLHGHGAAPHDRRPRSTCRR